jgi:hypothetical protein
MVQRYAHLSREHKRQASELLVENSPAIFTTAPQRAGEVETATPNVVNMMGR